MSAATAPNRATHFHGADMTIPTPGMPDQIDPVDIAPFHGPAEPDDAPETWEQELSPEEATGLAKARDRAAYGLRGLVPKVTAELAAEETLWQLGWLLRTEGQVSIPGIGTVIQDGDTRYLEPPRDLVAPVGASEEDSE